METIITELKETWHAINWKNEIEGGQLPTQSTPCALRRHQHNSWRLLSLITYRSNIVSWRHARIQIFQSVYIVVYGNCGEKKKGGKKNPTSFLCATESPIKLFQEKKSGNWKLTCKKKHETGRSQNIPPTGSFIKSIEALKQRTLIMSLIQTTTGKKQLYPNGSDLKASLWRATFRNQFYFGS